MCINNVFRTQTTKAIMFIMFLGMYSIQNFTVTNYTFKVVSTTVRYLYLFDVVETTYQLCRK